MLINDIHIESSTICNGSCNMCPHKDMKRSGKMSFELFKKIANEAIELGIPRITPFRLGEPFLFDDLYKWLDYLDGKPIVVSLFTNGSMLSAEHARQLEKYSNQILMTISFHGYDKQSYESTVHLNYEKTRNSIIEFITNIKNIPVVIYCLLKPQDADKAEMFNALWSGYNFCGVGTAQPMEWAGKRKICETKLDFMKENPDKYYRVPCDYVLHHMDVTFDGKVCLCCVDSDGEIIFGDLNYQTITEIYNSSYYQFYLEQHNKNGGIDLPLCSKCSINIETI